MAEFGDRAWDIDRMTIPMLITRLGAARQRQRERRLTLEAHQHFAALQAIFVHNSSERLVSLWARQYRPRFLEVDDLLRPAKAFDITAFRERQAASYDRRLSSLLRRPLAQRDRWAEAKDATQEGYLMREAILRRLDQAAAGDREALLRLLGKLRNRT